MKPIPKTINFPVTQLYDWYDRVKRDLPWRLSKDPYQVWISEIILQQTRVDQGLPYYNRFVDRFPKVEDLANAPEDDVLKLWEGLGYYSRARNLHATAKAITSDLNGVFPDSYKDILKLKGVGPYTAAAIGSICFEIPEAAVDGNVYRVLSRYYGIRDSIDSTPTKKQISVLANEIIDRKNPGDHNQAVMELGATVCTPKSPICDECPLAEQCVAHALELQLEIPVRTKKIKVRERHFYYLVPINEGYTAIKKREAGDIWQGLYEFPLFESEKKLSNSEVLKYLRIAEDEQVCSISEEFKHILSHQRIFARFVCVETNPPKNINFNKVKVNNLSSFAFPRLINRYLEKQNFVIDKEV